jgi:hypothetical protein
LKQCPACNRTYADDTQVYCLEDGSVLRSGSDAHETLRIPAARATDFPASGQPAGYRAPGYPPQRSRWPMYALIAVVCLLLGGGLVSLLIFGYSRMTSSAADPSQSAEIADPSPTPPSTPTSKPTPSPASQSLVGVWRTNVYENKVNTEITLTFRPDGTSRYLFKDKNGKGTDTGTWQYSDETLFERFSNGASGRGSIRWIDQDTFEITIIDNGVPSYAGVKRRYTRVR